MAAGHPGHPGHPGHQGDPDTNGPRPDPLRPQGGNGAELRGHVPRDPRGVVLLLHGGAVSGRQRVRWSGVAVLRMMPFALALTRRAGDELAVLRLKYRVRGWNGADRDPVVDAAWALARIRDTWPGLPIALVGHSMGGRVALHLGTEPGVAAVVALAPWIEGATPRPVVGTRVLLVHGTRDGITSPRRTATLAGRLRDNGIDVRHLEVQGGDHPMLRQAGLWHDTAADFVTDVLLGPARTS